MSNAPKYLAEASDGAAAIVLVSGEKAKNLGLQVLARIIGYADASQVKLTCLGIMASIIVDATNIICEILTQCSC
jgi:hypothetical protein